MLETSNTFTAIDFETSNQYLTSICQVGLVRIEDGIVTNKIEQLIQPPNNFFLPNFTRIHGITAEMTVDAPSLEAVWDLLKPYIAGQTVVAHNGFDFDFKVLDKTLEFYGLEVPPYKKVCTLKIYKKGLSKLAEEYQLPLEHHNALSDALCCAELYLKHLDNLK